MLLRGFIRTLPKFASNILYRIKLYRNSTSETQHYYGYFQNRFLQRCCLEILQEFLQEIVENTFSKILFQYLPTDFQIFASGIHPRTSLRMLLHALFLNIQMDFYNYFSLISLKDTSENSSRNFFRNSFKK